MCDKTFPDGCYGDCPAGVERAANGTNIPLLRGECRIGKTRPNGSTNSHLQTCSKKSNGSEVRKIAMTESQLRNPFNWEIEDSVLMLYTCKQVERSGMLYK
ncbi:magnesium-chelatase subunit chlH [Striga asiatica]|uniref:Magnesium-chelatase subunit chlH n=1 Tax=Striga asiatica TaxID=4170 RepID=A0A5A7Q037_STRAF|nr:magnesium-chelatase subunit chlH [Striga asiatica]